MAGTLSDVAWLTEQCATRSAYSLARELGVSGNTVLRAMRIHGIPARIGTSPRQPDPVVALEDPVWLAEQYAHKSAETIGAELGLYSSRVRRSLKRHGIPVRGRAERKFRMPAELDDAEWLRRPYEVEGKTGARIAEELGVSIAGLHKAMHRLGIESDGSWVRRDLTRLKPPSREELERAWGTEQSLKGLARRFDVSPNTVAVWLADIGMFLSDVPVISRSQLLEAIEAGKSIQAIVADHGVTDRTVMIELRRHGQRDAHRHRPKVTGRR